jgi:hypothetical protein
MTLNPFSERNFAAVEPAGPAPTTVTSYFIFKTLYFYISCK